MNYSNRQIVWKGTIGDVSYRIVNTGADRMFLERSSRDMLDAPKWDLVPIEGDYIRLLELAFSDVWRGTEEAK